MARLLWNLEHTWEAYSFTSKPVSAKVTNLSVPLCDHGNQNKWWCGQMHVWFLNYQGHTDTGRCFPLHITSFWTFHRTTDLPFALCALDVRSPPQFTGVLSVLGVWVPHTEAAVPIVSLVTSTLLCPQCLPPFRLKVFRDQHLKKSPTLAKGIISPLEIKRSHQSFSSLQKFQNN